MKRLLACTLIALSSLCVGCSTADTTTETGGPEAVMDLSVGSSSEADSDELKIQDGSEDTEVIIPVGNDQYAFSESDSHLTNSARILDSVYSSENVMISPLSLDLVLAMAANGADDATLAEYNSYFGQDLTSYNDFYQSYITGLTDEVEVANGIFVRDRYTLNESTSAVLQEHYMNSIHSLNFDDATTVDYINNWCSEATNGTIPHVVDDVSVNDSLLINALYFNDDWAVPVETVTLADFSNVDGSIASVNMMDFVADAYFENEHATGFVKMYENERYGFIGILPNNSDASMSGIDLDSLLASQSYDYTVYARMPEFSFNNSISMTPVLESLGLDVFTNGVYDNFINETGLVLTDVLQVTRIEVDRTGTEASAVTIGSMKTTSAYDESDLRYVYLNRPFMFIIYDFENDVPLFMGRVSVM